MPAIAPPTASLGTAQRRRRRAPSPADRLLLSRFSFGATPELVAEASQLGGARRWLTEQMQPDPISDSFAAGLLDWFPGLDHDPLQLWERGESNVYPAAKVNADFGRWTLLRRTYSRRQLLEVMTDFWSNLLHVPVPEHKSWPYRRDYDKTIRRNALGRFETMLFEVITHPAMGGYLDNGKSTQDNPNENLGRELLELHTVGVDAGYSEDEVKVSALILTGYRVDVAKTCRAYYDPLDHYRGPVSVLGFSDANSDADGRPVVARYLHYLAHHPLTARRVARRMCVRFVSDEPSAALVTHVAGAFTRSGTDIKATLSALVDHPEFARSVGAKVRTPVEDAIATYRVLGVRAQRPVNDESFANALLWQTSNMGQRPFDWSRPDGFPDVADAWTGVSRMLNAFRVHQLLAGGYQPSRDVVYRQAHEWLPRRLPTSLGAVVNRVSVKLLARPASDTLQAAVATRLGLPMTTRIRSRQDMADWRMVRLLATVLDTPEHMTR